MDTLINIADFYYKDKSKGLLDSIVYTLGSSFMQGVKNIPFDGEKITKI